jgi:hypothetical protein
MTRDELFALIKRVARYLGTELSCPLIQDDTSDTAHNGNL